MAIKRKRPVQYQLRISKDMHDWLKQQAEANERSINSEINFHLENNRKLIDQQETTNVSQPTQTN